MASGLASVYHPKSDRLLTIPSYKDLPTTMIVTIQIIRVKFYAQSDF
jgi:hypothetical protein